MNSNKQNKYYIGIDPDVKGSGFCFYGNKDGIIELSALSFFDLINTLNNLTTRYENVTVVIESAWLKKSVWVEGKDAKKYSESIAIKVGRNHQIGILLEEYCFKYNINYILKTPSNKKKHTITNFRKITNFKGKVNQDMVDACMLVYGY